MAHRSAEPERLVFFVYGTLKHKFPNWHLMPSTTIYLGTGRTSVPYPLVIDTEMGVPYVLELPGHPHAREVHGELYSVTTEEAEILDRVEGVSIDFYVRKGLEVIATKDPSERRRMPNPSTGSEMVPGSVVTAQTYFRSSGGPAWAQKWTVELLQTLPMIQRYTTEHTKKFVPRDERST